MNPFEKQKIICTHKCCTMFYKCSKHKIDEHLHCIGCGTILTNEKLLKMVTKDELLNTCTLYKSRSSCEQLTDHL